jgi:hypothetical protein
MPLTSSQRRAIRNKRENGVSIAVISSQLKIPRAAIREVVFPEGAPERHGYTSELLPGISQMTDEEAKIARQPENERDEELISVRVWEIASEIRQAANEKRRSECHA